MENNLKDISWQVTEEEYRQDPALSYSTLAKYEREGFNKLDSLFDKVESPSLTFGSAVDSIITGGQEEFNSRFLVAEFPSVSDSIIKIVKQLFTLYSGTYNNIEEIPTNDIIAVTEELKYQLNWKPETRVKVIKEQGFEYYKILYLAQNKTILDSQTYEKVQAAVRALKESEATKKFFAANNPFDGVERFYQLKFKATLGGINYRVMADLLYVDHNTKTITPIDLKTSSHTEWDFYQSFVQWSYQIQARLYWRVIRANLNKYPEWKDYRLDDYLFIVVNKDTLTPLVWEFTDTQKQGLLEYGVNNHIKMRDPFDIGEEVSEYLNNKPIVPKGISLTDTNSITEWFE